MIEDYNAFDFHRQLLLLRQQQLPFLSAWPIGPPPPLPGSAKGMHQTLPYNLPQFNSDQFTDPPVLQNPERVVRLSDGQRFETNFQPNVALAPRKQVKESPKDSLPPTSPLPPTSSSLLHDRDMDIDHEPSPRPLTTTTTTTGVIAVIKQEPEIKEEPPSTPPEMTQSPEPRYSPATNGISQTPTGGGITIGALGGSGGGGVVTLTTATSAASPGEVSQSGSNEITSSTSPVPAISHATSSQSSASSATSLPLSDNNTTSTNNTVINKQESISPASTPTPTPPHKTTTSITPIDSINSIHHHRHNNNHHHHHNNHHHHHQRSQMSPMFVHKNGTNLLTTHGSELELSTDTDEESIAGEPDSSCVTFDLSADLLKDVRPEQRDKLLSFIKMLIAESGQAKQLRQELRSRDEQIDQLLQENKILRKRLEQYERHMVDGGSAEAQMAVTQIQSSVIARPEVTDNKNEFETTTTTATTTMATKLVDSPHRNGYTTTTEKSKSEYLIKPLKKSLRRSPEDTVVIMQPKRDEIKIVTNGELVPSVN